MPYLPYLFLLIFTLAFNTLSVAATANSIVALVNDTVINFATINKNIKPNFTKAKKISVINQEINLVLQLMEIQRLGITPKPIAINTALARIASKNALTLAQLRSDNKFDNVVREVTRQLSLIGLKQLIIKEADIKLTDAEIQSIPNEALGTPTQQIKIAQIVINSIDQTNNASQSKDALIKQFLTKLSTEIKQGASFASMAKLHSQDASYRNGGTSRWFDKQKLFKLLPALSQLKHNTLSQPFKTQQGWMLAKIIDEHDIDVQYTALKQQKLRTKQQVYYQNWLKKLRKNAYIEIFDHKL